MRLGERVALTLPPPAAEQPREAVATGGGSGGGAIATGGGAAEADEAEEVEELDEEVLDEPPAVPARGPTAALQAANLVARLAPPTAAAPKNRRNTDEYKRFLLGQVGRPPPSPPRSPPAPIDPFAVDALLLSPGDSLLSADEANFDLWCNEELSDNL